MLRKAIFVPSSKYVKLLKVLDIMSIHLAKIPPDIKRPTLLKFLGLTIEDSSGLKSLFRFCCLIIVLDCEWDGYLPRTFWDMQELRHFHLKKSFLSNSSTSTQSSSTSVLERVDAELPLRVLNNFLSMPHLK